MIYTDAILFGYNDYAKEIAKQIKTAYRSLKVYSQREKFVKEALNDGFDAQLLDLDTSFEEIIDGSNEGLLVFCALEDDAENIFLTISVRAAFEALPIIALASTQESVNKLKIAGAQKVIAKLQTTSDVISELLEKPLVTEVMHDILFQDSKLKLAQITIEEGSCFSGVKLHDIDLHEEYGIIILAIVDQELSTSFIFTTRGYNHQVDPGDILVVIGYEDDIEAFETAIGGCSE